MALQNVFAISNAVGDGSFDFLKLCAALPAGLQMSADFAGRPGRQFAVGIAKDLVVFGVTHGRLFHTSPFLNREIARRRNSPTAEALMPSTSAISG